MAWPLVKRAASARTMLLGRQPDSFIQMLTADLHREEAAAHRMGQPLVCRLNTVSDVAWEREFPTLFTTFPDVQFMDYTKDVSRILGDGLPANYHLTFSRSEINELDCLRVLKAGHNVTAVFRAAPFPATLWGYPVIDGDIDDLRFLDPRPRVVGLRARGVAARKDQTGFVLENVPEQVRRVA